MRLKNLSSIYQRRAHLNYVQKIICKTKIWIVYCQIKIVFAPSSGDARTLGIASTNNTVVDIEIYYPQINHCQKTCEAKKYRYVKNYSCYSDSAMTTQEIGVTIRHEFGHALGLIIILWV